MAATIGTNLKITIFGESHGEYIGATLDGLTPGIKVDYEYINKALLKRRPLAKIETARVEKDEYKIISGVFNGYTTGAPITVIIPNTNVKSSDYDAHIARPSHADYVAHEKYFGFNDYRGGGHFSGRLTAPIVVLGAIVNSALEKKVIHIGTHIKKIGNVEDNNFSSSKEEILDLKNKVFPTISNVENEMEEEIIKAANSFDSIGGILQTCINGLPVGIGEPYFDSLESCLSHAMFSIGGVKGIEFGLGFNFASKYGSEVNDEFYYEDKVVKTKTNNNGGINGGISNGQDIIFNLAIKPTPSIAKVQNSIDFINKENVSMEIKGRHDPAFIRRLAVVVESLSAIVVSDLLLRRYGIEFFR